jgi:hypothetical protein
MKTRIFLSVIFGLLLMAGAFAQESDISISLSPKEFTVNP